MHSEEKSKVIADTLHKQEVEQQNLGLETVDENTKNEVEAIVKKDSEAEVEKEEKIREKATKILESWSHLQEVFTNILKLIFFPPINIFDSFKGQVQDSEARSGTTEVKT